MSFSSFALDGRLHTNISRLGYTEPTPIQSQAVPVVLSGGDVIGLAQTGTGKTAAFALPILHRLLTGARRVPRALVIAPTRELADQIAESFRALGEGTGIRCATLYGGVPFNPQARRLREGVEIVVACPGRLLDHLEQGTIRLAALEVLVLDEADHMFDMGFLPTIRRILQRIPSARQSLLFSATMPNEVLRFANEAVRDATTIKVGRSGLATTVAHALYPVQEQQKLPLLLKLLAERESGAVIVFTRTKHRARKLGDALAKNGHRAVSLQGNLSQSRRKDAMDGFRSGRYDVLVATDIAARGIDVSEVDHVINFDMPDTVEAYTHRIGRTGRAAREGDAVTFVTREDESLVRRVEHQLRVSIERCFVPGLPAAPAGEKSEPGPRVRQGGGRPARRRSGPPTAGPRHPGARSARRPGGGRSAPPRRGPR